ncbi:hypothetical protein K469DRAFT_624228 [Zopfia rhizophila CBS 207.26]|uniref:Sister chromatid cohesion protein Ctf8 n=1 Tax=Zopfia rhizophila CBS 207.26 TaxID=1314779 RepID=A0A6A6EIT8_9PEZI|nr:hypothetical protein K469DRAFT_624228 [Zopfia rhizophila CBS 207.26]
MPTIPLHISKTLHSTTENPLPPLLLTPSGLAILELQGTIHFPTPSSATTTSPSSDFTSNSSSTQVGKLVFPLYNPKLSDPADTKWMKRVYFYVGKHQRLNGEVKKLGKPFAIIRKRERREDVEMGGMEAVEGEGGLEVQEELEIVEVVRYKIVFSTRPEPVGGEEA